MVGKGREREKIKIIVPITSYQIRNREFQKNRKKIQKIQKYHYRFFSSQNRMEKAENRENKNYGSVPFLPDGVEKIQKK